MTTPSVPMSKSECGPRGRWSAEGMKTARQVRTLPARWSGEGGGREDPGGPLRSPPVPSDGGDAGWRSCGSVLTSFPPCLFQAVTPGALSTLRWAGPADGLLWVCSGSPSSSGPAGAIRPGGEEALWGACACVGALVCRPPLAGTRVGRDAGGPGRREDSDLPAALGFGPGASQWQRGARSRAPLRVLCGPSQPCSPHTLGGRRGRGDTSNDGDRTVGFNWTKGN